ncbi:retrotransposon protein, putative, ty1-copia subclass [Tanacetum coccineum]
MTTTVVNNSLFRSLFEKQKLTGNNFMEWYRNLWIVLSTEDNLPFLEQPIPTLPVPPKGQANPPDVVTTHQAWVKAQKEIARLMLMTIDPDIQKNLEHLGAYDMLKELKMLYVQQADQELLQTVQEFHVCKQEEGHMGKTVTELHATLKLHEKTLLLKEVSPALHAIRTGRIQKTQKKKSHKAAKGNQGKGKAKMGYAPVQAPPFAPKPKNPPTPKKDNHAKDAICHQCGKVGHCPIYLAELMKKKKLSQRARTSAVEAIGEFHLCLPSRLVLILHNCPYAPSITRGIISVSLLYKDGFVNRFENDNSISVSRNNLIYFNAIPWDNIYEIVMSSSVTNDSSIFAVSNKRAKLNLDSALLWHCRLGHINKKLIEKLQHDGLLDLTDIKSFEKYVACMFGKRTRKPYSHQVERAKDLLGLIHTDGVENQLGKTIKSLRSDRGGEYMSQEFLDHLRDHGIIAYRTPPYTPQHNGSRKPTQEAIKSLRSDRGGEYMSQEFLDHLMDHGIIAHRTPPYTPQHNGVLKRRNRTLLDMVRSMMSQTTLPKSLLGLCALESASHLNMVPTNMVDNTHTKIWQGKALAVLLKRYPKETIGYSFYYPPENKVFVARNAEFLENSLINLEASRSLEDLDVIQEEDMHPSLDTRLDHKEDDQEIDEPQSDINLIRKCPQGITALKIDCVLYVRCEYNKEKGDLGEPANYKAALLDHESNKWINVMNVKMQSMKDNEVWELVDLPPDGKIVGHKWLFKKKTDMDGAVHTYKARLVAKGFTQTPGIDYEETFSPVADIRAIRILIAIAAFYDYEIWQMDVKTAFLNGYLNEEVYMEQPEGFVSQKFPNRKFRFSQNRDEPCVYVKASGSYVTFLILYVDDILIMGNNILMLQDVKSYLGRCFAMKDLGEAAYILGIKIYWDRSKRLIGLCQSAYIEKILKRYYMENSKRGTIPMQKKLKFSKSQGASIPAEIQHMQNIPYALAVRSIMCAVRCTHPDVAFAQNITSRFQ